MKSFSHSHKKLYGLKVKKQRASFELKKSCERFCFHQESLWCPYDCKVDIYSLDGRLQRSVECPQVVSICALHPITPTCVLLSARSGLYTYSITRHAVSNILRQGVSSDVHASGKHIVALEQGSGPGDLVHVFSTIDPPTHSHSFCVNHTQGLCLMVHNGYVYVSSWSRNNTSVSVYTVEGQMT